MYFTTCSQVLNTSPSYHPFCVIRLFLIMWNFLGVYSMFGNFAQNVSLTSAWIFIPWKTAWMPHNSRSKSGHHSWSHFHQSNNCTPLRQGPRCKPRRQVDSRPKGSSSGFYHRRSQHKDPFRSASHREMSSLVRLENWTSSDFSINMMRVYSMEIIRFCNSLGFGC